MPTIHPRGSRSSKIWVICERPYPSDVPRGYMFSGGMGFIFEKMCKDAGLNISDMYICARRADTDNPKDIYIHDGTLNTEQPPFIIVLNETGTLFLPELRGKDEDTWKGQLQKNVGSLLSSSSLSYPHYMMPLYGPDRCIANWEERNVCTYIDLQKLRDEYEHWKKNCTLKPLPERKLVYGDLSLSEILSYFQVFSKTEMLSVDIETVYPRGKSAFHPHPGYPITIGIADSPNCGISFNLFRSEPGENRVLWRALDELLHSHTILGQNFFNFDALFFDALGYRVRLEKIQDTLLRHHILWPELSHKLQFMTRQYTREPYYKDEGHGWSIKNMGKLRRYNCLDVCVTYEIWLEQEKEFDVRPHLR